MLKQILKDMYVAPEILAELPEEQKQILFFKIREEQKRRYYEYEKKHPKTKSNRGKTKSNSKRKNVKILEDSNSMPWTWVMGEHPNDIPLELLWSDTERDWKRMRGNENKPVSKVQALIFSHNKNRNTDGGDSGVKSNPANTDDSNQKTQEIQSKRPHASLPRTGINSSLQPVREEQTSPNLPPARKAIPNKPDQPSVTTPKTIADSAKDSENDDSYENWGPGTQHQAGVDEGDAEWKKQLKRFKDADRRRSAHARRASLQVRRLSQQNLVQEKKLSDLRARFERKRSVRDMNRNRASNPPKPPPKPGALRRKHPMEVAGRGARPTSREQAEQWLKETQLSEIVDPSDENPIPKWFHGVISRDEAEQILEDVKVGDYLVRVSDKIWGFALSYKDEEKIKHFLIDGSEPNCYHFFGNDQIRHPGLEELITFHKEEPISYGNEVLKNEVGQRDPKNPDYADLIKNLSSLASDESQITRF